MALLRSGDRAGFSEPPSASTCVSNEYLSSGHRRPWCWPWRSGLVACASGAQAGILLLQPVGFSEGDLEKSLSAKQANGASSTSTGTRNSQLPSQNRDDNSPNPLGLLKAHLP